MSFAFVQLFQGVRDWFATPARSSLGVVVAFGRRAVTQQINQGAGRANRVVFVPGEPTGGKAGSWTEKLTGELPRNLAVLAASGYVEIWAADTTDLADEAKQHDALWTLAEFVATAMRSATPWSLKLGDPEWVIQPVERVFGAALRLRVVITAPLVERKDVSSVNGAGYSFSSFLGSTLGCTHTKPPEP